MGTSLGGFNALKVILRGLPKSFPAPVVIVQHRSASAMQAVAGLLQEYCVLPVTEPEDKELIVPGHVYLAASGYHLLVEKNAFALSTDAPVHHARPSIDVLFESAAESFGSQTIGVALTSSSVDGVAGMTRLSARGGLVVVQDPAAAESRCLVDEILRQMKVDVVLPLYRIAPYLTLSCQITASPAGRPAPPAPFDASIVLPGEHT